MLDIYLSNLRRLGRLSKDLPEAATAVDSMSVSDVAERVQSILSVLDHAAEMVAKSVCGRVS